MQLLQSRVEEIRNGNSFRVQCLVESFVSRLLYFERICAREKQRITHKKTSDEVSIYKCRDNTYMTSHKKLSFCTEIVRDASYYFGKVDMCNGPTYTVVRTQSIVVTQRPNDDNVSIELAVLGLGVTFPAKRIFFPKQLGRVSERTWNLRGNIASRSLKVTQEICALQEAT